MYITIFLLLISFISSAYSSTLTVTTPHSQFKLEYSLNKIELKGSQIHLSILERECSISLLSKFYKNLQNKLSTFLKYKVRQERQIKYSLNSERYYAHNRDQVGKYLLSIPLMIKRLKIQEKIKCDPSTSNQSKKK
ncbi:MAG: hypothetical protein HON90_05885 [Halobacteriovoraceae bacterium]|jgi:hypothetical protein|nr:hypothetical protein [Halobacteriovoraceae bacterium]